MRAQVVVLAGPSGAGKSRVAERLGLPVLRLDDFYRSGGDPALPRIVDGPNAGIVDWDHPDSWLRDDNVRRVSWLAMLAPPRASPRPPAGSRPAAPCRCWS